MEKIVGMKEFAEMLGWSVARLSVKYHRQQVGMRVRPPLPTSIQTLSATPVWLESQAVEYKKLVDRMDKK